MDSPLTLESKLKQQLKWTLHRNYKLTKKAKNFEKKWKKSHLFLNKSCQIKMFHE